MKLMRSRTNRLLAGVLGGAAEAFGMNATLLRILFVILVFSTAVFPMALLYLVLVFVMSNRDGH